MKPIGRLFRQSIEKQLSEQLGHVPMAGDDLLRLINNPCCVIFSVAKSQATTAACDFCPPEPTREK